MAGFDKSSEKVMKSRNIIRTGEELDFRYGVFNIKYISILLEIKLTIFFYETNLKFKYIFKDSYIFRISKMKTFSNFGDVMAPQLML